MLLAKLLHFGSKSAQMAVIHAGEEMVLDLKIESAGEIEAQLRIRTKVMSLLQLMLKKQFVIILFKDIQTELFLPRRNRGW
jgi:hypothetical protein